MSCVISLIAYDEQIRLATLDNIMRSGSIIIIIISLLDRRRVV